MSKERFDDIINEGYKNYFNSTKDLTKETLHIPFQKTHLYGTFGGSISNGYFRPYTRNEFTNKIKNDDEFSEMWELKIKERELDFDERKKLMDQYTDSKNMFRIGFRVTIDGFDYDRYNEVCDQYNIPTKEVTLTYNNQTVSYYE